MDPEKEFRKYLMLILSSVADAGERGIPSGHLYAALMGDLSHERYNVVIQTLVQGKMITSESFLLRATEEGMKLGKSISKAFDEAKVMLG